MNITGNFTMIKQGKSIAEKSSIKKIQQLKEKMAINAIGFTIMITQEISTEEEFFISWELN